MRGLVLFRHFVTIIVLTFILALPNHARAAEGVREVDLSVISLVYDPFTQRLYGASSNNLLQVDSDTGQVLQTFDLGSPIRRLALGAGNGLWAGLESSVRRFNLQTLSAEDPISIGVPVLDISPSLRDPQTIAVSTPLEPGTRYETVWVMRNGAVLPVSAQADDVALKCSVLFRRNDS